MEIKNTGFEETTSETLEFREFIREGEEAITSKEVKSY